MYLHQNVEEYQINNLMMHQKSLENQEQSTTRQSRLKKIIKIRDEINEIEKNKNNTKNQ